MGESGDGADAVALARLHEPDIVVIDLRMPVLDGLDAGAFAYLDKGTLARRVHRVLLGAAVRAVLAANAAAPDPEGGRR